MSRDAMTEEQAVKHIQKVAKTMKANLGDVEELEYIFEREIGLGPQHILSFLLDTMS